MKKTILILMCILLSPIALAQETESNRGVTPDQDLLWNIDILIEKIQIFLTKEPIKKIELRLRNVEERLEEIKLMVNENKLKAVEMAEKEKQKEEENILKEAEKMPEEIKEKVLINLQKHIVVLRSLKEKLPEQAQKGIDNAISKGEINIERFRKRIEGKVCCKITPVVAPEYVESSIRYGWKLREECTSLRNGEPIVGVSNQIVEDKFCKE